MTALWIVLGVIGGIVIGGFAVFAWFAEKISRGIGG
jgi:hypothetical protein